MRDGIRRRWHGKSPPSPEETRQFLKEEDDACTAAREAVSARSAGRSRAEIRQMFIGELRSRGRAVPDDLFLDFEADMIVNTIPPDASMFTAVKALVKMFLRGRALDRELAGGVTVTRAQDLRGPRGQAPYLVPPERSLPLADVILDPGAEAVLRPLGDEPVVSLERVSPGGAGPVVVYVGDQRVGTVGPRDGPRYGPALEAAQRAGRTLMVHGVFSQAQDGVARLQVYPAGIL